MAAQEQPSLFISYSHTDAPWMEMFRKELKAALYEQAVVWCDLDIADGAQWQDRLALELRGANLALVLATGDYLISPWCRRELSYIAQKEREKSIQSVFWVQVKPCAWERSELAAFQSRPSLTQRALSEIADPNVLQREIVDLVREIASTVDNIAKLLDPNLTFARTVAGDEALRLGLTIESLIADNGDFSVICRGRLGEKDVAIKVLRRSPMKGVLSKLQSLADSRKGLSDPGFIQLHDAFLAKNQYGDHLVLVSEYCRAKRLSEVLHEPVTVDRAVLLIRRAAEALEQLHRREPDADGADGPNTTGAGYGPMPLTHVFYDERLDRLRFSSLSISNFMWDTLGWRKYAALVDSDSERLVAPEQIGPDATVAAIDKQKLDQYMLGQLTLEILDGGLWFERGSSDVVTSKGEFFDDPLKKAGAWRDYHQQLAKIVRRLLDRFPENRYENMRQVVMSLRTVESEGRALARYGFLRWLDNDEFFAAFYESFFAKAEHAKGKFKEETLPQQYNKLRMSMTAVLNFYAGNEPTSLRHLLRVHKDRTVTQMEYEQFRDSFLEVLAKRLARVVKEDAAPPDIADKVQKGWKDLFEPVVQYLRTTPVDGVTPPYEG